MNNKEFYGENVYKLVIEYMKAYREKEKITQQQLAEKSGIKQPMIARIESGKTDPQLSTFTKLVTKLGLRIKFVKDKEKEMDKDLLFAIGITQLDGPKPSEHSIKIAELYLNGDIDLETAKFAIKREFVNG